MQLHTSFERLCKSFQVEVLVKSEGEFQTFYSYYTVRKQEMQSVFLTDK